MLAERLSQDEVSAFQRFLMHLLNKGTYNPFEI